MKQEKYRFAVLLHSYEIIEECKKAMVGCPDEIHYDLINFETGPQKARECLENGYEVILCHGGTGDTIFRSVPPVYLLTEIPKCSPKARQRS